MLMLWLLAQAVAAPAPVPAPTAADPVAEPAAALYEELCLKAFPDDAAVDALMEAKGATPLTPAEVKVTLVDDPGRGWRIDLAGDRALVFLELPPYHACSVRWSASGLPADLSAYRTVTARYVAAHPGFAAMPPFDRDKGDIHITATGLQRALPGGGESLFVIEQHVTDPKRRAAGETGVSRRFVHQIRMPEAR